MAWNHTKTRTNAEQRSPVTIQKSRLRCSKAIPHKDCATDASSNFSSDKTKSGVNTWCIHEHFGEIWESVSYLTYADCVVRFFERWREICKQMACKVARRSLCGVALYAVRKVTRFAASPLNVQVYEKSGSLSKWTDPKKLDKIFKKNYAKRLRVILVAFVMLLYACIRQEKVHQA